MFLLYYPLKQGLKLFLFEYGLTDLSVFTLLSIKTRIETNIRVSLGKCSSMFLLYYPLKQGLKHSCLLYTSDAADDLLCVDIGGGRIIKKKKLQQLQRILI